MATETDWARAIGTTITNYLRQEEIAVLRKYRVYAALESSGNVLTNQSGRGFSWEVKFRQQPVSGNNGETPRTFARHNLWKTAKLDYRGYQVTDAIYRREMLENRGQQALINVAGKMAQRLQESMESHLSREVYVDGDAVGAGTGAQVGEGDGDALCPQGQGGPQEAEGHGEGPQGDEGAGEAHADAEL